MSKHKIVLEILGQPKSLPRTRVALATGRVYNPAKHIFAEYQGIMKDLVHPKGGTGTVFGSKPVKVSIHFEFERPPSHYDAKGLLKVSFA